MIINYIIYVFSIVAVMSNLNYINLISMKANGLLAVY